MPAGLLARLAQRRNEQAPVLIAAKDVFLLAAAIRHVVDRTGILTRIACGMTVSMSNHRPASSKQR